MGDPVADQILKALRSKKPNGMNRTEISGLFQRHVKAVQIDRSLELLLKEGKIRREDIPTEGRPIEMWFAV
jgi:predicted transcriptional regulator